jgi:hypothetical protein
MDAQNWVLVVGFFLPIVLSVVIQTGWPKWVQSVLLFVMSVVVAAGTLYFAGQLDFSNWVSSTLVILVTAIATYHGLWKPTSVSSAIEQRTNIIAVSPTE